MSAGYVAARDPDHPDYMPDAEKDPNLWKHSMRGKMHEYIKRKGIRMETAINDLMNGTIAKLEEIDALGEEDQAFQILDNLIKERDANRFASLPSRKMTPAPEPKRPIYDAVQRWLMSAYKEHLPKDGALAIVRGWMKAARLYDEKLPELERLANVTMQAENYAFNRDHAYQRHFAAVSAEGHALWMHVHEACAAHKHPVPLNERANVLLSALGAKDTLFNYTGTAEQAREKFDKFLPDVGLIPDTDAATAIQEDYMQTAVDKKRDDDLNEWFPRDEDKPARNYKSLWPRLYELYDSYVTPVGRERQEYIHDLLDVKSLNDIPAETTDNQIVINLKAALDARHKLKANTGEISPENTPKDTGIPKMQNEAVQQTPDAVQSALPEAPFSANFKLINKHGIDVQFTVRADTVSEGVKRVDLTIDHLLASGWSTQRQPPAAPMQNAQTGGASAPAPQQGNEGKSPCFLVSVTEAYSNKKPQLEFTVDGFDKPLRFTGADAGKLAEKLKGVRKPDGSEFTAADMTIGRKYGGNWIVRWRKGEKYTDVLEVLAA